MDEIASIESIQDSIPKSKSLSFSNDITRKAITGLFVFSVLEKGIGRMKNSSIFVNIVI